jgi:hypothetical protein
MMVMDVSPATVVHHFHRDHILVPLKEYVYSFVIAVMSSDMLDSQSCVLQWNI